jgi:hypothetical protein
MNVLKVKPHKIKYTDVSKINPNYTNEMNKVYTWMAKGYDAFTIIFKERIYWKYHSAVVI